MVACCCAVFLCRLNSVSSLVNLEALGLMAVLTWVCVCLERNNCEKHLKQQCETNVFHKYGWLCFFSLAPCSILLVKCILSHSSSSKEWMGVCLLPCLVWFCLQTSMSVSSLESVPRSAKIPKEAMSVSVLTALSPWVSAMENGAQLTVGFIHIWITWLVGKEMLRKMLYQEINFYSWYLICNLPATSLPKPVWFLILLFPSLIIITLK